jgi:hypothetical protein
MTTITTIIRNRRIDVPAPSSMPDGMEVVLNIGTRVPDEDGRGRPRMKGLIHEQESAEENARADPSGICVGSRYRSCGIRGPRPPLPGR